MATISTLQDFYKLMRETRVVRKRIVLAFIKDKTIAAPKDIQSLKNFLASLETIPQNNGQRRLKLSEDKFYDYLNEIDPNFTEEVNTLTAALKNISFKTFISDRDGTVNNYCGRYASSIQSVYNAIFLTRFAYKSVDNAAILTSAPLDNIGLVDISVSPVDAFINAGSKGREYFNKTGQRCQVPIEEAKQEKLNSINTELSALVKKPEYERFSLIGSGLQFKFGQTTIARQDISKTIPEQESENFLKLVSNIVKKTDPNDEFFRIEDTGKDIEIILTIENDNTEELKDFDKGDGVKFLNDDIPLNTQDGITLICGDTGSDVPMVSASMEVSKKTFAVFVTRDDKLKEKVKNILPAILIVSTPDVLVAALINFMLLPSTGLKWKLILKPARLKFSIMLPPMTVVGF